MSEAWKTVRVFISSTFRDMQAERDHLVRFVFPKLREELLKRRIHLVDVDLRWGVTSDQDVLEVCREVVDECRPRFVCVLGGRYGSVPPGKTRSITADEVHYGVLDRIGNHGFTYFYFRNPAATAAMVEAKSGEFREPDGIASQQALEELKMAIVSAGLQPFIYQAQWDNDAQRLIGLKSFGAKVYADLKASIDQEFGEGPAEKLSEFAEESAAMEAFIQKRTERFVLGSRKPTLDELLGHAAGTGGNGYLCLVGEPGSGKSALLAHLSQHSTLNSPPSTLLISHFVGASIGSTDVRRTLRRLCHGLTSGTGLTAEIPEDPEKLRVAFPAILQQACAKKHVVILFDAVNQIDTTPQFAGLWWLPQDLPDNARIILSTLPGPALDDLRRRRPPPHEVPLPALTQADGEAIIREFLHRYRKTMTDAQRAALLAKTDAGTPLYVLAALEELRTLGTYEEISDRIAQLPPETQALFTWILKRLEDDDGFRDASGRKIGPELVPRFASLMAVSRHGLSQWELAELLAPGDPNAKPAIQDDAQGNVAALMQLLRPYLMRRGELLDFYHGQIDKAAEAEYLDIEEKHRHAHTSLADYFDDRWRRDQTAPDLHAITELPHHLFRLQWWTDAVRLYLDYSWLTNVIRLKGWPWLLDDSSANLDSCRVRGLEPAASIEAVIASLKRIHFALRDEAAFLSYIPSALRNDLRRYARTGNLGAQDAATEDPAGLSIGPQPNRAHLEVQWVNGPGMLPTLGTYIQTIAVAPNSNWAVTAGACRCVWRISDASVTHYLDRDRCFDIQEYDAIAISVPLKCVAMSQRDRIQVWRADHGAMLGEILTPAGSIHFLSYLNTRNLLLAVGYDGVALHETTPPYTGRLLWKFSGRGPEICAVSPDETALVFANGKRLCLYELNRQPQAKLLNEHSSFISAVCFGHNGSWLISGDEMFHSK